MTTAAVHDEREAVAAHGPKYFVNIEGEEYPWDRPTITVLEIRLIGRLPEDQPVIEINLEDNTERTLGECEVVEIKPGHAFAKKVRYKRG
jgi:Multiubiquitin